MEYICGKCGKRESVTTRAAKCECGGLWKLDFKPPKFSLVDVDKSELSMFRYRKFMALEDESWKDITLGEGMIPEEPGGSLPHFVTDKTMEIFRDWCDIIKMLTNRRL